jgi:MoxR-like ATPase
MKDDGAPLSSRAATGVVRRYSELYREAFTGPRRCVVLIDELDKAPRDTPNDLLGEIERMEFQISELGVEIRGDQKFRPIVVVTSNSEKGLPDPFLRRCVYHNIEAPSSERRRAIVGRQQSPFSLRGRLFDDALNLFERIRANLARPPGTAELLAWLDILEIIVRGNERSNANSLTDYQEFLPSSLGALAKSRDDLERAEAQIRFAN